MSEEAKNTVPETEQPETAPEEKTAAAAPEQAAAEAATEEDKKKDGGWFNKKAREMEAVKAKLDAAEQNAAQAKEQLLHSFNYNFRDRKARKGDFRKLWIQRINAAVRAEGITYNRFIQGLRLAGIELDRRALAEIAVSDPDTFKTIVDAAKAALPEDVNAPVEA